MRNRLQGFSAYRMVSGEEGKPKRRNLSCLMKHGCSKHLPEIFLRHPIIYRLAWYNIPNIDLVGYAKFKQNQNPFLGLPTWTIESLQPLRYQIPYRSRTFVPCRNEHWQQAHENREICNARETVVFSTRRTNQVQLWAAQVGISTLG